MGRHRTLEILDLKAGYDASEILHGINLHVDTEEIVSVIGPNGCGKSTVLRAIMGLTQWSAGHILFQGADIRGIDSSRIVAGGIGYVPQLENVFSGMTVTENLQIGGYLLSRVERKRQIERSYELFPVFKDRRAQAAGTMSGGERQTLALAMALMTSPKLILLDEPSAGLSPKATHDMYGNIVGLPERLGMSVLIVEQDVHGVLEVSQRTYVLSMGANDFDAPSGQVMDDERIRLAYLGEGD